MSYALIRQFHQCINLVQESAAATSSFWVVYFPPSVRCSRFPLACIVSEQSDWMKGKQEITECIRMRSGCYTARPSLLKPSNCK